MLLLVRPGLRSKEMLAWRTEGNGIVRNKIFILLYQTVLPSDGIVELCPPSGSVAFFFSFVSFVSSLCRSASEPRNVEDSDALPASGPGAAAGGAVVFISSSITLPASSSQFFFSFARADRIQGTVIAAHIAAQIKGTAQPKRC